MKLAIIVPNEINFLIRKKHKKVSLYGKRIPTYYPFDYHVISWNNARPICPENWYSNNHNHTSAVCLGARSGHWQESLIQLNINILCDCTPSSIHQVIAITIRGRAGSIRYYKIVVDDKRLDDRWVRPKRSPCVPRYIPSRGGQIVNTLVGRFSSWGQLRF